MEHRDDDQLVIGRANDQKAVDWKTLTPSTLLKTLGWECYPDKIVEKKI